MAIGLFSKDVRSEPDIGFANTLEHANAAWRSGHESLACGPNANKDGLLQVGCGSRLRCAANDCRLPACLTLLI
jgi:hypothetical protein